MKGAVVDIDGTVLRGEKVLEGALDGIGALREAGVRLVFFSNNPTKDGKAYVEDDHPGEAAAIAWLDDREGQPHIVSPPGREVYSWSSPAASLTGLPTVVGWVYQEGVYRGSEKADLRASDVDLVYTGTWDDRAELLEKYDVRYIYVGPSARDQYDDEDLRFEQYPGIEEAFREGDVVVYEVTDA